ncbi:MAG: hypothetical protein AAGM67_06075, partial [Bacteroidota bacterium]
LRNLLLLGVLAEALIFGSCYWMEDSLGEVFRHAARYSGRLSAGVFLYTFFLYASNYAQPIVEHPRLRNWLSTFAVLHVIHFGFLAANVVLNDIPIVPVKLTGGALAYLMIVAAPFYLYRLKRPLQLVYFYYVSLVMIITYVARAKGDFEGAEPFWFHYVALGIFVLAALGFAVMMRRSAKPVSSK